jgi:hypothetical protein
MDKGTAYESQARQVKAGFAGIQARLYREIGIMAIANELGITLDAALRIVDNAKVTRATSERADKGSTRAA